MLADLVQDCRLGLRQLARSPGFTVAAVLCLALGIGANTAVFSVAELFLFRSLPVERPGELVRWYSSFSGGVRYGAVSYPDFVDIRDHNKVFSGLAASSMTPLHLSADGRNERLWGELASAHYFSVLSAEVALGRGFLPQEGSERGAHPVVVLSHGLWRSRFGSDPAVVGRPITLNGHPFTVVGVAAETFHGGTVSLKTALWLPIGMQETVTPGGPRLEHRGSHWLRPVIGRLRPGVTIGEAESALNTLMAGLAQAYPSSNTGKSVVLVPEAKSALDPMVRGRFAGFLGLMFGVVGIVLLLACSNVASLVLARGAARRREVALRLALGAGRGRLVRQLVAESAVLAFLAGGAGLLAALGLTRFLASLPLPLDYPIRVEVTPNPKVLAFTLGLSILACLLFGLVPALRTSRPELAPGIKEGAMGRGGTRLSRLLVAGQVALSMILLVGSALVLESLANARRLELGFDPERQLLASLDLGLQGYDEVQGRELFRVLEERVRALPGVTATGWAQIVPLSFGVAQTLAAPEGYQAPAGGTEPYIDYNRVGPGYFESLGLPLLAGRGFEPADGAEGQRAIVVNRAFADTYWPGQSALGKRVDTFGGEHLVVGMAATGKYWRLGESPRPYMYLPIDRYYEASRTLHVRTAGDPGPLAEAVRREIRALDAQLPIRDLKLMTSQLGSALLPARLAAVAVSAFSFLALLLAAVGLYAVIAFWVAQRVPEIGLRLALGARAADIRNLVLRQGLGLTAFGLGVGLAGGCSGPRPRQPLWLPGLAG